MRFACQLAAISALLGIGASSSPSLHSDGPHKTGCTVLPAYRNASLSVDARLDDLLKRMTLEEKAGQMFQRSLVMETNGTLDLSSEARNSTEMLIGQQLMTHFNLGGSITDARVAAEWHNRVQQKAAETRLGIPVTISSDPRHSFTDNVLTGATAGQFSQWPETLGLAALRDPELVRRFADIARQEYMAVGIRAALHPRVDVATEGRWARVDGTFGEDAHLIAELLVAYLEGFQGETFGHNSVTTVTKHFPGGGPQHDGEDSHFWYGRDLIYPGNNFDYHLIPFRAVIAAGARQIMPAYARMANTSYEPIGAAFSQGLVTDLLRGELGFDGIVVTDWAIVTHTVSGTLVTDAHAVGVEHLTDVERVAKIIEAGCDQLGGESRPEVLVGLVKDGAIPESRLDISVRRLMREKFLLGLFDNPFVDPEATNKIVGREDFVRLGGRDAQRRSYTLLTNNNSTVPLANLPSGTRLYIEGIEAGLVAERGFKVVSTPEEADYALLRLQAPYTPRSVGLEVVYHAGTLEYTIEERARQAAIYSAVPTIVDIIMDRPAAIPEIFESAAAVFTSYGSSSAAFMDVVFGEAAPEGKLPFDLPRSMVAVEASFEDVPFDTVDPVFRFGHGLSYA